MKTFYVSGKYEAKNKINGSQIGGLIGNFVELDEGLNMTEFIQKIVKELSKSLQNIFPNLIVLNIAVISLSEIKYKFK